MNTPFESYLGSLKNQIIRDLISLYESNPSLFIAIIWEGGFSTANLRNEQTLQIIIQDFICQCNSLNILQLRQVFTKLCEENPGCESLRKARNSLYQNFDYVNSNEDCITKYLVKVKPKLISQGCSSIYNDIIYDGKVFKQVAKAASFKTSIGGLPMRGEAFFIFSYFSSVNDNSLREFATNCFNYAKKNSNFSGILQTVFNLKIPTNICFSISMTNFIDEKTKQQITETNPFEETVDILWYIVPIVYTLNEKQVYFYEEVLESKPWEFFRGEIAWKELRKIIKQTLSD